MHNRSGRKMEDNEIIEGLQGLPPSSSSVVAIAINGNSNSKYIVQWALKKFVPEGKVLFKLLHVRPRIQAVPTPAQVQDDIAAFRQEVELQTDEKLIPYKKMCAQGEVQVEVIQIESNDVASAIAREVAKCKINKLVIGASSHSMLAGYR